MLCVCPCTSSYIPSVCGGYGFRLLLLLLLLLLLWCGDCLLTRVCVRAQEALRKCLPDSLRDQSFSASLKLDEGVQKWLVQLIKNLTDPAGPVAANGIADEADETPATATKS